MKRKGKMKQKELHFQIFVEIVLMIFLIFSFIPVFLMIFMSSKTNWEIYNDFFALPRKFIVQNYVDAFGFLAGNMINTLVMIAVSVVLVLILSVLGGFAFGIREFPGKNLFYTMILMIMMVPGSLSFAANYTLIRDYGLMNSRLAIILPWVASGIVMGVILCRNTIETLPKDLFEAAKMEGCGDGRLLLNIAVPLMKPVLSTIAIMKAVDFYNDYIWPMMVIESNDKQLITVVLKVFTAVHSDAGMGIVYAGYIIASIPLLILFLFTSRLYMEGMTAGAIKG